MQIFTIGFTRTSAEDFFSSLRRADVRTLVDVRLNNRSQLSGFSKKDDLIFFAREIAGIDYRHLLEMAPTPDLLNAYRSRRSSWEEYACRFRALIEERRIDRIDRDILDGACLLCSEKHPTNCHRRLVAEYLGEKWGNLEIVHL